VTTKQIQAALGVTVDGIKGPKTIAAIKAFQSSHGLVADGIVGPKTTAALKGGGGDSTAAPAAAGPSIDQNVLAQNYGFAMSVLNSDPELKSIFDQAVAGTWTAEKFTAALRNTKWYQGKSDTARNAAILKSSDPATYANNLAQVQTKIGMMASQMGAAVGNLDQISEQALQLGWDDNQINQVLGTYVTYTDGRLLGQAGQWEQQWRKQAADQGLNLSDDWYRNAAQSAASGKSSPNDAINSINEMAASAFPNLADQIRAGQTLSTIADPYKQSMSSLLEVNPDSITLQDNTIRKALAMTDPKTGTPVLQNLFDFENTVRSDPRWLGTKNAQDAAMSTTNKVLTDFGLLK